MEVVCEMAFNEPLLVYIYSFTCNQTSCSHQCIPLYLAVALSKVKPGIVVYKLIQLFISYVVYHHLQANTEKLVQHFLFMCILCVHMLLFICTYVIVYVYMLLFMCTFVIVYVYICYSLCVNMLF